MAYLSKKDIKWSLESATVISRSKYTSAENSIAVSKSIVQSKNLNIPSIAASQTSPTSNYSLPSLTPIVQQEGEEVQVLTVGALQQQGDCNTMYGQREQDRKVRREIANSNERRRMQSINAGFKSLKAILPHTAGDKLSKAAILQQTADYIFHLDSDKAKLLSLNEKLRSALLECKCESSKRRALFHDVFDKDEGIGSPREEDLEEIRRDTMELHIQLEKERRMRLRLEEKVRELESQSKSHEGVRACQEQYRILKHPSAASLPHTRNSEVTQPVKNEVTFSQNNFPLPCATALHSQQVNFPLSVPTGPSPVAATEPVTNIGICATMARVVPIQSPPAQTKSCGLPRSSQPLKKRAIEIIPDSDCASPKNKVPKVQAMPLAAPTMMNATNPLLLSSPPAQSAAVLVHRPTDHPASELTQQSVPLALQPSNVSKIQERLVHSGGIINSAISEQPMLLTTSPSQAYITLTPSIVPQKTWSESSVTLTAAPNYSVTLAPTAPVVTPTPPQFVLQQSVHRVATSPEEITLNELNSVVPPLSMTLTQLNALPAVARLNATVPVGSPALPSTRVQTQFLPVVAMDTVLSRQSERRVSLATADSAPSDEDCKGELVREDAGDVHGKIAAAAAIAARTKSDPIIPRRREIHERLASLPELNTGKSLPTTLSFLSNGPGSPPVIRHIDAVATRRNLETIVQAIDHLEQQERRNSQDQQIKEE